MYNIFDALIVKFWAIAKRPIGKTKPLKASFLLAGGKISIGNADSINGNGDSINGNAKFTNGNANATDRNGDSMNGNGKCNDGNGDSTNENGKYGIGNGKYGIGAIGENLVFEWLGASPRNAGFR